MNLAWLLKVLVVSSGPFFKEWIMGFWNHPYDKEKNKNPARHAGRASTILLLLLVIALCTVSVTLYEENYRLKHELKSLKKQKPNPVKDFHKESRQKYDLLVCDTKLKDVTEISESLSRQLAEEAQHHEDTKEAFAEYVERTAQCQADRTTHGKPTLDQAYDVDSFNTRLNRLKEQ